MAHLLDQLAQFIQSVIATIGYPGIGFLMFAENLVPPIPSEMVMPFAGFLASRGELSFLLVALAGMIGSVLGALVLYGFGAWAGDPVVRGLLRRYGRWIGTSETEYDRALHVFDRYGTAIIFFGRLIPMVRSLISIPAGANHMPLGKFLIYTSLGSLIWTSILTYAGYLLGENWQQVLGWVEQYQSLTIVVGVVLFGGAAGFWIYTRMRRARTAMIVNPAPDDAEIAAETIAG